MVIMKNSDETVVQEKICRLIKQLENCKMEPWDDRIENIDVAIGYCIRHDLNDSLEQAMIEADDAMHNNKNYR